MSERKIYAYIDKANMAYYAWETEGIDVIRDHGRAMGEATGLKPYFELDLVTGGRIVLLASEIKAIKEIAPDEWARIDRQQGLRHAGEDAAADEAEKRFGGDGKILKPRFTIPGKKP